MNTETSPGEEVKSEESMEEILHSIRDIIAHDDDESIVAESEVALELTNKIEEDDSLDVLDDIDAALDSSEAKEKEEIEVAPPPQAVVEEKPTPEPIQVESSPAPIERETIIETPANSLSDAESLISAAAAAKAANSLRDLVNSTPQPQIDSPLFREGFTLEDLVIETLKPMLSTWLDDNLPVIVEDLVQQEIRKLLPRE